MAPVFRALYQVIGVEIQAYSRPTLVDKKARYEDVVIQTVALAPLLGEKHPELSVSPSWDGMYGDKIKVTTVSPNQENHFELGAKYYADFTKVE